jgi:hypothetical protein
LEEVSNLSVFYLLFGNATSSISFSEKNIISISIFQGI